MDTVKVYEGSLNDVSKPIKSEVVNKCQALSILRNGNLPKIWVQYILFIAWCKYCKKIPFYKLSSEHFF